MGIYFRVLPKYSPELNPCELIFALVKDKLRWKRGHNEFWIAILRALSCVTHDEVAKFYYHYICEIGDI